jgi:hypothetical protein
LRGMVMLSLKTSPVTKTTIIFLSEFWFMIQDGHLMDEWSPWSDQPGEASESASRIFQACDAMTHRVSIISGVGATFDRVPSDWCVQSVCTRSTGEVINQPSWQSLQMREPSLRTRSGKTNRRYHDGKFYLSSFY